MLESDDVVFAVESIPAFFAIAADPFFVFTSNVFRIPGLLTLFFALVGMIRKFRYFEVSLAIVLAVAGPNFELWLMATVCAVLAS